MLALRSALSPSGATAPDGFEGLIGRHPEMVKIYQLITQIATTPATVLISGESGTGKELVARAIHRRSDRSTQPFVAVNVRGDSRHAGRVRAVRPREGRLHRRASRRKLGKFELAARRHALPGRDRRRCRLDLQAKLLRALQEREIERLGGSRPIAGGRPGAGCRQRGPATGGPRPRRSATTSTTGSTWCRCTAAAA